MEAEKYEPMFNCISCDIAISQSTHETHDGRCECCFLASRGVKPKEPLVETHAVPKSFFAAFVKCRWIPAVVIGIALFIIAGMLHWSFIEGLISGGIGCWLGHKYGALKATALLAYYLTALALLLIGIWGIVRIVVYLQYIYRAAGRI